MQRSELIETTIYLDPTSFKKFNKDFVLKDINAVLNSNEILGFLPSAWKDNNDQNPHRTA